MSAREGNPAWAGVGVYIEMQFRPGSWLYIHAVMQLYCTPAASRRGSWTVPLFGI